MQPQIWDLLCFILSTACLVGAVVVYLLTSIVVENLTAQMRWIAILVFSWVIAFITCAFYLRKIYHPNFQGLRMANGWYIFLKLLSITFAVLIELAFPDSSWFSLTTAFLFMVGLLFINQIIQPHEGIGIFDVSIAVFLTKSFHVMMRIRAAQENAPAPAPDSKQNTQFSNIVMFAVFLTPLICWVIIYVEKNWRGSWSIGTTEHQEEEEEQAPPVPAAVPLSPEQPEIQLTALPLEQPTALPPEQPTALPPEQPTALPPEQPTALPPEQPAPFPPLPTEQPAPPPAYPPVAYPYLLPTAHSFAPPAYQSFPQPPPVAYPHASPLAHPGFFQGQGPYAHYWFGPPGRR